MSDDQPKSKKKKIVIAASLGLLFFFISVPLLESGVSSTFIGLVGLGLFFMIRELFDSSDEEEEQTSDLTLNKD